MQTSDIFPDLDERGKLHGVLTLNLNLRDIGSVLTALEDSGFEIEINLARKHPCD